MSEQLSFSELLHQGMNELYVARETKLKPENSRITLAVPPETEDSRAIIFQGKETDILVLRENGDILVHGKIIENDKQVVDALREFLTDWGRL